MIIIDKYLQKLEQEGKPIRIGLWGAGEMAKGMVNQVMRYTPGMEVAVIANRTIKKAKEAYEYTGTEAVECNNLESLQNCISSGGFAVTENAELLCEVDGLDLLVECTGTIHYAANLVFKAIQNKKHVLLFNPEIDATIGPILKVYADKAGVMLSGCDGDQPGVIMNLYRFVKSLGLQPLICGNIKGLQDFYRNPTTQAGFAARWHLTPEMVTQFADGTKISIENNYRVFQSLNLAVFIKHLNHRLWCVPVPHHQKGSVAIIGENISICHRVNRRSVQNNIIKLILDSR